MAATQNSERLLRFAWLLLLVLTISLYLLRQIADGPFGKDFTIFLTGAHLLLDGHAPDLYSIAAQTAMQHTLTGPVTYPGGVLPFNYPPYVAALFVPVALFPANVAFYIWLTVQWIVLGGWAVWVMRSFRSWGEDAPSLLIFAIFSFAPIIEALLMGQMSIVSVVLWWWAFVGWRAGKDLQLGTAVALAAFKPQMVLLLVVALFAQKKWRALAVASVMQALLWIAAILLGGFGIFTSYIDMLRLSASTVGTLGFYPGAMPNLRGLLTIMGISTDISLWVALIAWLLSLAATYLIWSRPTWGFAERFGLTAMLAVLFSPHLYTHDAALLILAVICSQLSEGGRPKRTLAQVYPFFALLFLSVYALVLGVWRSYIPTIISMWLLGIVLAYLLLRPMWGGQSQSVTSEVPVTGDQ
jgi:hypothetical protein